MAPPPPPAPAAAGSSAAAGGSGSGRPTKKKKSKAASLVSGAVSGALVSACLQPLDVVRTRMQADVARGVVRSTLGTMQTIMAEVGFLWACAGTVVGTWWVQF